MRIRAGELCDRLTIYQREEGTDAIGQPNVTLLEIGKAWGKVEYLNVDRKREADQLSYSGNTQVTLRRRSLFVEGLVFEHEGQQMIVDGITPRGRHALVAHCHIEVYPNG
ncbi:phage head completion protein [Paraferrimonas haliotis]|uniref:Head-tail adaptor n=1 Tax=Paraferrimonas haliotis TaxID=2013866 RepID=A0AA37WXB1_9GAMM|nr:head-tail adaptor protein [Paraferrimonas haliotis]GLS83224.1 hypothetical protein GCM10007894_12010 [Paraferrimonas haliotis]